MKYVKKLLGGKIYVRSKFPCVRSSHDLCACAHALYTHWSLGKNIRFLDIFIGIFIDYGCIFKMFLGFDNRNAVTSGVLNHKATP